MRLISGGVELGKQLAKSYAGTLVGRGKNDQVTNVAQLIQKWQEK